MTSPANPPARSSGNRSGHDGLAPCPTVERRQRHGGHTQHPPSSHRDQDVPTRRPRDRDNRGHGPPPAVLGGCLRRSAVFGASTVAVTAPTSQTHVEEWPEAPRCQESSWPPPIVVERISGEGLGPTAGLLLQRGKIVAQAPLTAHNFDGPSPREGRELRQQGVHLGLFRLTGIHSSTGRM